MEAPFRIQHADSNVSPMQMEDYVRARGDVRAHLLVASDATRKPKIFSTIQGEGPFAGYPAVFVRLAGCNRGDKIISGCAFCDTSFEFLQGVVMSFDGIRETVEAELAMTRKTHLADALALSRADGVHEKFIVITGGEPMLQLGLVPFIEYMIDAGYRIQIESNGDRLQQDMLLSPAATSGACTLVVSPKVNPKTMRYRTLPYQVWDRADYLKVLIDARPETGYHELPDYLERFANLRGRHKIYLSPLTVYKGNFGDGKVATLWDPALIDHERTRANYGYAAGLVLANRFVFSNQTHLLMELE